MNKVSNTKIVVLAFFAGMCLAFLMSTLLYHYQPFELSPKNILGSLFSGGVLMMFFALIEIKKDTLPEERLN